jgi:hypothetical protein
VNRRSFLRTSALAPLIAGLAACGVVTTTTTNGVTSLTINVAQLNNWGQAFINMATLLAPLIGPVGVTVLTIGTVAKADLTAVDAAAGGSLSLSFDSTSVPAVISSLLADGQKIVSTVGAGVTSGAISALSAEAQTYLTAGETILSLFSAALGSVAASASTPRMTEASALAALRVN